jgi:hypothetical protein
MNADGTGLTNLTPNTSDDDDLEPGLVTRRNA